MKTHYQQKLFLALSSMLICVQTGLSDVDVQSDTAPESQRQISLEGQSNFRDLGGYKTTDGRTVKWRQIYRSGELPKLTEQDLDKLKRLELKSVVNFLTDAEIESHGRDRLPEGVQQIHRPIESDVGDLAKTILESRKTADFSQVPPDLNPQIHRLLVTDETARKEYAALLRMAADPENRPLVFHCSHGVHRTGTGAAILLSALGVPWETVRKDYLLSNKYREVEVKRRLEYFRQEAAKRQHIAPDQVDMTNFEAFYILQGSYIDAARKEILEKYDSMEGFLREGLRLSDEELVQLRSTLLE